MKNFWEVNPFLGSEMLNNKRLQHVVRITFEPSLTPTNRIASHQKV